jgi:hypothetical protein
MMDVSMSNKAGILPTLWITAFETAEPSIAGARKVKKIVITYQELDSFERIWADDIKIRQIT